MSSRSLICLIVFMASSCAFGANPRCKVASIQGDVLINTSKMFLKSEGEPDYEEFEYRVIDNVVDGCYVVGAATTPDAFDSEILIFIGRDGVVRAVAPDGKPFFDTRGDRESGLLSLKTFPLVK